MNINYKKMLFIFEISFLSILIILNIIVLLNLFLPKKSINLEFLNDEKISLTKIFKDEILNNNNLQNKSKKNVEKQVKQFNYQVIGKVLSLKKKIVILKNIQTNQTYTVSKNNIFDKEFIVQDIDNIKILIQNINTKEIFKLYFKLKKDEEIKEMKNVTSYTKKNDIIKNDEITSLIKKEELLFYKKNIMNLLKDISFQEIYQNNIYSFKILKLKENSIFDKVGLKENDLLIKINNNNIENYEELFFFFNNLDNLDKIEFEILRDNKRKNIVLKIS